MSDKLTNVQANLLMKWLNATLPDVAVPARPAGSARLGSRGLSGCVPTT